MFKNQRGGKGGVVRGEKWVKGGLEGRSVEVRKKVESEKKKIERIKMRM